MNADPRVPADLPPVIPKSDTDKLLDALRNLSWQVYAVKVECEESKKALRSMLVFVGVVTTLLLIGGIAVTVKISAR